MFQLTREVRFAVNREPNAQLDARPTNSYAGFPSVRGFGTFLTLQATLAGELDPASNYLVNIKEIDSTIRKTAIPFVAGATADRNPATPELVVGALFGRLQDAWSPLRLQWLRLSLSPFLSYSAKAGELPMVLLSQKFEFSATHRLHNPILNDEQNVRTFGKCNNPHGHGHNYELQVTLVGMPDANGLLINIPVFETIVGSAVIDKFDHKNLNIELPEFRDLIPTVENIARVIYRLLKPRIAETGTKLASVTVWETPKTWCEYAEE